MEMVKKSLDQVRDLNLSQRLTIALTVYVKVSLELFWKQVTSITESGVATEVNSININIFSSYC